MSRSDLIEKLVDSYLDTLIYVDDEYDLICKSNAFRKGVKDTLDYLKGLSEEERNKILDSET